MATFSKATFNTAKYASIRPTYPRQLYDFIFKYHERGQRARWGTAVDLGCGTGQATTELTAFQKIIGVDPSAKMIEEASKNAASAGLPGQIEYKQSSAEVLPFLEEGSVDLIASAQAAHWFNWNKLWKEAARALRKDGSLAVWGYSEFRLTGLPSATRLINEYSQGSDPLNSLGPYWERPGRTIVDEHLVAIPDPETVVPGAFRDLERVYFTGEHHPNLPNTRPVILRKKMSWDDLMSYLRTFSSLHSFHEKYPDDLQRPDGDIALRFLNRLKEDVAQHKGSTGEEVDVEWPLALILARRA
ncbi:S-adenosyl-L-methionine-dependent methyltransferase [Irpex rosettiformis]|uniref:S-adenosyl-L-methionine-dependent methyltransferase n=1 Tax=Irpex rosettiformis TaxID=378272 RepID=A0ACB8TYQ2_9APHY|nr:S-adenosyl-L-methionine-dependent methyltransferase [Irpex rosettiformis]